jgi:hypothetical protein
MVITDFDIDCFAAIPGEADAVLLIDAVTVLAFAMTVQGFEPVACRDAKVAERGCEVQSIELTQRDGSQAHRSLRERLLVYESRLGVPGTG